MQVAIAQLHWSKNTNTLSTEASDLYRGDGNRIPTEVTVVGKTRSVTFRNPVATKDAENDTLLWTYTNTTNSVRLVVFND
jgi:hypothetical protein